jgi:hypothetical protein
LELAPLRRYNVSASHETRAIVILTVWVLLFTTGILVDTTPYRNVITFGNWTHDAIDTVDSIRVAPAAKPVPVTVRVQLVAWPIILIFYSVPNLLYLCMLSAMAGVATRILNRQAENMRSPESYSYTGAALIGFIWYLFFFAGLVSVASITEFITPSNESYLRRAPVLSIVSFMLTYNSNLFTNFITQVSHFAEVTISSPHETNARDDLPGGAKLVTDAAASTASTTSARDDLPGGAKSNASGDGIALKRLTLNQLDELLVNPNVKCTILHAWSRNAGTWTESLAKLAELNRKYGPQGLAVISLLFDASNQAALVEAERSLNEMNTGVTDMLVNEDSTSGCKKLGVNALPAVVVYNSKGETVNKFTTADSKHPFPYNQVEKEVADLLVVTLEQQTVDKGISSS